MGIRGTNRSYYLFDGLGSVVAVTSSSGSVTNSYTYDPYGVTTETKATLTNVFNPWRYTGQYQDVSTGLYKMGRGTISQSSGGGRSRTRRASTGTPTLTLAVTPSTSLIQLG